MMPHAVVFDLDGTLYDNRPLHWFLPLVEMCCLKLGFLSKERRVRSQLSGNHFGSEETFYCHLFNGISASHPEQAERWYHHHYMPLQAAIMRWFCHPYPWVLPRLAELRRQGVKLALYSDYGFAEGKLQALGIEPSLFDLIIDAPSLGGLKPCAESAQLVVERLQVHTSETLFVGDRDDLDGESARRIGAQYQIIHHGSYQ